MNVCSNCGAPYSGGSSFNCEFCGHAFKLGQPSSYDEFIKAFHDKMEAYSRSDDMEDKTDAKCHHIKCLYVPSDKESLIQLSSFIVGEAHSLGSKMNYFSFDDGEVLSAWVGKANEVSSKMRLLSSGDGKIESAISMLENLDAYRSVINKSQISSYIIGFVTIAIIVIWLKFG